MYSILPWCVFEVYELIIRQISRWLEVDDDDDDANYGRPYSHNSYFDHEPMEDFATCSQECGYCGDVIIRWRIRPPASVDHLQ